jgi:phage recombination protein Bet
MAGNETGATEKQRESLKWRGVNARAADDPGLTLRQASAWIEELGKTPKEQLRKGALEAPPGGRPVAEAPAQNQRTLPSSASGVTDLAHLPEAELMTRYGCTRQQYEIVRNHIARNLTPDQMDYFLSVAKMRGLSPWARQVYAMVYKSRTPGKADSLVIQTGIDGFVRIAHATRECDGIEEPEFGPEVKTDGVEHPEWARVRVWRKGASHPFVATARWKEYRKMVRRGDGLELDDFWRDMPYGQLGKCATSKALRLGFPEALAGIYSSEEMSQASSADREDVEIIDTTGREAPPASPPPEPTPSPTSAGGTAAGVPHPPAASTSGGVAPPPEPPKPADVDPAVVEMVNELEAACHTANAEVNHRRAELVRLALSIRGLKDLRALPLEDLDKLRTTVGNAV